jgi:hypothetical protein
VESFGNHGLSFLPKLCPSSIPAGLLAYSTFDNLPASNSVDTVVFEGSKAAGAYSSGDCSGLFSQLIGRNTGFPF